MNNLFKKTIACEVETIISNEITGETIVIMNNGVVGKSQCNFKCDNFDKEKGVLIAYTRAIKSSSEITLLKLIK